MHPKQASLLNHAAEVVEKFAAKKKESEKKQGLGQAYLWKYTDPDGNIFYLDEKKISIKSPFSGKTFTSKPVKHTPMQVGKEMKEDAKAEAAPSASKQSAWKV